MIISTQVMFSNVPEVTGMPRIAALKLAPVSWQARIRQKSRSGAFHDGSLINGIPARQSRPHVTFYLKCTSTKYIVRSLPTYLDKYIFAVICMTRYNLTANATLPTLGTCR